ncbi:MAG: arginine deiminase family protein, partial [Candidatus Zixiibacteriota bacterium]
MKTNGQSEIGTIRSILLKHPKDAFLSQGNVDQQWRQLNYTDRPDYKKALEEYETFLGLLREVVFDFHFLPEDDITGLDSIYLHDPVIITKKGAILCNMGKQERENEPAAVGRYLTEINVPIAGKITGEGRLEGGDVVWLDEKTLAVGQSYRTNAEGIRQLKSLTEDMVEEFVVMPLPHWKGPGDVMHLMSIISPIDSDLAVVYSPLMPVPFREYLIKRGIELVEVPVSEFDSMGCNVLAIAPRRAIMLNGNPVTQKRLEASGAEVMTYDGYEISRKGAGGPT